MVWVAAMLDIARRTKSTEDSNKKHQIVGISVMKCV